MHIISFLEKETNHVHRYHSNQESIESALYETAKNDADKQLSVSGNTYTLKTERGMYLCIKCF